MIPGVSAFWSHEKHGPKPPLQVSSLLPAANAQVETARSDKTDVASPTNGSPKVTSLTGVQEEWPVLPVSNSKRKCIELPEAGSPLPLAPPGLPHVPPLSFDQLAEKDETPQSASESTSVLGIVADGLNDKKDRICSISPNLCANELKDHLSQQYTVASEHVLTSVESASSNAGGTGKDLRKQVNLAIERPMDATQVQGKSISDNMPSPKVDGIAVFTATPPLMPNVRLSPAPTADERMTISVEGLSKDESEESIKERFRAYGRIVSPVTVIVNFHVSISGYWEQVNTNYKEGSGPKPRCTMFLSYNSVHSARKAADAENGKIIQGHKQIVKLIQAGNVSNARQYFCLQYLTYALFRHRSKRRSRDHDPCCRFCLYKLRADSSQL